MTWPGGTQTQLNCLAPTSCCEQAYAKCDTGVFEHVFAGVQRCKWCHPHNRRRRRRIVVTLLCISGICIRAVATLGMRTYVR